MAQEQHLSVRKELEPQLAQIKYLDLLAVANFTYSEDSNDKHHSPCFRRGGRGDRSDEKVLLMNKGQLTEFLLDLRENKGYDKFSFMLKFKDDFFARFHPHAWGNDIARMKDVVRNMTGSLANSQTMQQVHKLSQEHAAPSSQPFDPSRWYFKPLMETDKASVQQMYLTRERGLDKETVRSVGDNVYAIADLLKFKAPNTKKQKEIAELVDKLEVPANKKEMINSFIRSMENIDTHFNKSAFKQNILDPLEKTGIPYPALKSLTDFLSTCSIFEMNRSEDFTQKKANKIVEFTTRVENILQTNGFKESSSMANAYSIIFENCFFEKQLQSHLTNIEKCLPECYIDNTIEHILGQLNDLSNYTTVSDEDKSAVLNFISNIHINNLKDSASYLNAFNTAFKCLSPESIYHFSPEYQPISDIRKNIINALGILRQHPILKTAAEIREMLKNTMYKRINIGFATKDLVTNDIKGFEMKSIKRSVKLNASGSDMYNYFVPFGQTNPQKVNHVFVFESSIDAISFLDIQKQKGKPIDLDNTMLVSCGGTPKSKHMSIIKETYPQAQVHLCLDRDFAGKQASIIACCKLQDLNAAFILSQYHDNITPIPENEKWDENKYPKKGRAIDPVTGALIFKQRINDVYDIKVSGTLNGEPYNKCESFLTDEISVKNFHERFPEVNKIAQYHIPTISQRGMVGKLELGGYEANISTKDWNDMITAPREIEKQNIEFYKNRMMKRQQEKAPAQEKTHVATMKM